jgi:hypothetical protein
MLYFRHYGVAQAVIGSALLYVLINDMQQVNRCPVLPGHVNGMP